MRAYESPTSCYMYDHCPKKYDFRYNQHLPDKEGPAARLGIAFEEIVYRYWNKIPLFHAEETLLEKMTAVLFSHKDILALPKMRSIQNKIDVPVGSSRLVAYLDILHEDDSITDIKTSKRKWSPSRLSETSQHFAYPYGAMKMGLIPEKYPAIFRYVIVTTTPPIAVQIITVEVSNMDLEGYEQYFMHRLQKIQNNEFPTRKSHECSWCPYKDICPAWRHAENARG